MTVRTRFAPSPTGYLHIGGVRTALFNWLFARKHGGQFILRIDDTDQGRNQPEALQPILDGFKWLGLDWDEGPGKEKPYGPYFQSQRLDRYQEAVRHLLDKGLAYWDYATPDEMKAEREVAEKEKRPYIYSRRWMAQSDADRKRFEAEGRAGSVRLKMPREGVCRFHDHVRGDVEVEWSGEQDTVIQRSDGTVTYNLANVVDDHDMKITHVIRAEEHLSNTPRQIFMLEGLGYSRPEYAHVPFVAEPGSKNKLSKRKIAQYLKNPEFKKVSDAALLIEDRLVGLAYEFAGVISDPSILASQSPEAREELVDKWLNQRWGPCSSQFDRLRRKRFKSLVASFLEQPELLSQQAHGAQILKKLPPLPPEAFNPVLVDFYRAVGYLQAALLNYLVLLGWATEDNREEFTIADMIRAFSLERVVKAPASLDVKKLFAVQAKYMQALPVAEKVDLVMPFLTLTGLVKEESAKRGFVQRIVEAAGPRIVVAGDILEYDYLFWPDELFIFDQETEAIATKHVNAAYKGAASVPPLAEVLPKLRDAVAGAEPFTHDTLKAATEAFAQTEGAKHGPLSQVLRVATTGKEVGFSAYDTLAVLGRKRCLDRIDRALKQISASQ